MPIKNLPLSMQPREKALLNGIHSLNDAELLALFLRTGSRKTSVLGLANLLLSKFKDLNQLSQVTINEIRVINGIGKAKAVEIMAIFEIAKRVNNKSIKRIIKAEDAVNVARQLFPNYHQEHFVIIVLSFDQKIVYHTKVASGKENTLHLSAKMILTEILKRDGIKFYCFHNHPSEKLVPSSEDLMMTETLAYYCDLFGIKLLGHYIVTRKDYKKIRIDENL